ncbi:PLP-dependent aminotransferase family protein [bacterium]|nr:PLP-dependent aminotransferase family protein [bacterium]MBP9809221.1 PLP-dependent aminotransferase family protein [bacterium]
MNWQDVFSAMLEQGPSEASASMYVYARIVETLKTAIEDGRMKVGDRLPTNRELAAFLKVDRSTVARAYLELAQLGFIASQVGRGTFVSSSSVASSNSSIASSLAPQLPSGELNWLSRFSRYADGLSSSIEKLPQLASGDDFISFAGGIPSQDSYPSDDFQKIVLDLLGGGRGASMFDYSPFAGEPDLRQAVTAHLALRGIAVRDQELLILSGSQQGIDLVANLLINPGDHVLVEEPTYFWAISNFKARQAQLIGCPLDDEGIDLAAVEAHLIRYQPKFIYVMPNSQNPTGITMSLARRRGLLALARKYQTPILEDDFSGDLVYGGEPLPSLRTLAAEIEGGENIVIYQGTFSKALCPGIRLGWLVGPQEVIDRLSFAKRTSDLATNSMVQVILTEFLQKGLYHEHLTRVNCIYGQRRDAILAALDQEFKSLPEVSWTSPTGGLFIWLTLPKGTSNRDLLEFAVAEKVVFSPGDICFLDADDDSLNYLRLCFIQNSEPKIAEGIKRLAQALSKYLAHLAKERLAHSVRQRRNEHVLI